MRCIATWMSIAALLVAAPALAANEFDTSKSPAVKPSSDAEYVVQKGDTLSAIAEQKLGSPEKWKVIAQVNGIDDPATLRVGQKLVIPTGEAAQNRSQL